MASLVAFVLYYVTDVPLWCLKMKIIALSTWTSSPLEVGSYAYGSAYL
jgi:hypothetical protein